MALSLDDRLLGEKTHYYCSSSSDEEDDGDTQKQANISSAVPDKEMNAYTGHCVNVSFLSSTCKLCIL